MKPKRKRNVIKKAVLTAAAAGLIGFGGLSVHKAGTSQVVDPDFTGRQKIVTLAPKSMKLYEGKPGEGQLIGETKYRLGKSSTRAGFPTYAINVRGETKGTLKWKFRLVGKKYSLEETGSTKTFSRPLQLFRKKWKLEENGKPKLIVRETTASFLLPLVHTFDLIEPGTNKKIGRLSAQWNVRRVLLNRRDYAIKFNEGYKGYLSEEEVIGVLTGIGKMHTGKQWKR